MHYSSYGTFRLDPSVVPRARQPSVTFKASRHSHSESTLQKGVDNEKA